MNDGVSILRIVDLFWRQSTLRQGGGPILNDGVSILRIVDLFWKQSTLRKGGGGPILNDGVSTNSWRTVIVVCWRIGTFSLGNFLSTMRHSRFAGLYDAMSIFPKKCLLHALPWLPQRAPAESQLPTMGMLC